jgi:diacylglycerol kinase (ATP)
VAISSTALVHSRTNRSTRRVETLRLWARERLPMKRWLAIVNPGAGRPGAAERCAALLTRDGLVTRVAVSRGPRQATQLALMAHDVDGVVAVGGDGTVHAILAGINRLEQVVAVMPVGHGNCLARDLNVPHVRAARSALRSGTVRPVDLMDVTLSDAGGHEVHLLGASTFAVGYVADVVARGRQQLGSLGRAAYTVASVVTSPRPLRATLTIDGRQACLGRCTGIVVNNTAHLANFRALRAARLDDGRLDVMSVAAGWARQLLHNTCILAGSSLVGAPLETQATSICLSLAEPETVMLDGELLRSILRVQIRALPGAVRCVGMPA